MNKFTTNKKRIVFTFVLTLLMLLILTSCGAEKKVPDETIDWVVEDYLNSFWDYGKTYTDYKYTATHSPDKATKTDTVGIELEITFPHAIAVSNYNGTYQYDKSRELWEVIRNGEWESILIKRYTITDSLTTWIDALWNKGNIDAEVALEGQEFLQYLKDWSQRNPETPLLGLQSETIGTITDGWDIGSYDPYFAAGCFCTDSEDNSQLIYDSICSAIKEDQVDYKEFDSAEGENYLFTAFNTQDWEEIVYLIRVDNTTFVVIGEGDIQENIELCLKELGFVRRIR